MTSTLLAGVAKREISPRKSVFLGGYPNVERDSEGIHDPLWATALCLRSGSSALITVSLDCLFISRADAGEVKAEIEAATGVCSKNIMISCTHTHSSPVTVNTSTGASKVDPEFLEFFRNQIIAAACASTEDMRPAELAWSSCQVDGVGCNRHDPNGPRDPEVGILAIRDRGSKALISVSLIYCMHPTVMHEDSKLVSSDFPYYARLHLNENLGDHFTVLYHTGPEGNQSPRYHVRGQTFEEAERLGRMLGASALDALRALSDADFKAEVTLDAGLTSVVLPLREMPTVEEAEATLTERLETFERLKREEAGHGPIRTAECSIFGAQRAVLLAKMAAEGEMQKVSDKYNPVTMQALRIGDGYIAAFPGEIFVEYGLKLKDMLESRSFAVCNANGELQGYIVTPEEAERGGYEASNATFAPVSGTIMVEALADLICGLGANRR